MPRFAVKRADPWSNWRWVGQVTAAFVACALLAILLGGFSGGQSPSENERKLQALYAKQDAVAASIDGRPPQRVKGILRKSGVFYFSCPRATWQITAIESALWGVMVQGGGRVPACNSTNVYAAVASACLGRYECFLLVNDQVLGSDPCPSVDKVIEAEVTCTPPQLFKGAGLGPLSPDLRGLLEWRESLEILVPARVPQSGSHVLSCPASDWRMDRVLDGRGPLSGISLAIQEHCIGQSTCRVQVAPEDTASLTLDGVVRVLCVPRWRPSPPAAS